MSSAPQGVDADAHSFDDEPVAVLPPDEPPTPAWLPLLGLVLLLAAGVVALVSNP